MRNRGTDEKNLLDIHKVMMICEMFRGISIWYFGISLTLASHQEIKGLDSRNILSPKILGSKTYSRSLPILKQVLIFLLHLRGEI